jgi:hypothetical protein
VVTRIRDGIVRATPDGDAINDPTEDPDQHRFRNGPVLSTKRW